jgi:hypothetical protein
MKNVTACILPLLLIACVQASDFPVVPKIAAPAKLDGALEDSAWKGALALKLEKQVESAKLKVAPVEPCDVRVFTDDNNLYVGFTCTSKNSAPYVHNVSKSTWLTNATDVMSSDNVCVVIDPGHWGLYSYLLVYVDSSGRNYVDTSWWLQPVSTLEIPARDINVETAVAKSTDNQHWTAAIKIPFVSLMRHPSDGMINKIGLNFRYVQWGADGGKVKLNQDWTRAMDRGEAGAHYRHMRMWQTLPSFHTWLLDCIGDNECWGNEAFLDEFGIVALPAGKIEVKPLTTPLDDDKKQPVYGSKAFGKSWASDNFTRMPRLDDIRAKDGWTTTEPKVMLPKLTAEDSVHFAKKLAVTKGNGSCLISFEADREADACVTIADEKGHVVRHLAAGMLGKNAPPPLKPGLAQSIEWKMTDDDGKPVPSGSYHVKVGLGLMPSFERALPMTLQEKRPALWAEALDVEHLPNPSGKVSDPTHGAGAMNLAVINNDKNEVYLPGYKIYDIKSGSFLRNFSIKTQSFMFEPHFGVAIWDPMVGSGELAFGRDGSVYSTGFNEVRKMDANGSAQPFSTIGRAFYPNIFLGHSNPHRGICMGGPDGDIYVIHGFSAHGNVHSQISQIGVDGRMKKYGFIELRNIPAAGIAVDRAGNVYVGCTINPVGHALPDDLNSLPDGIKKVYELCYGSIVKFPPGGGHVVWDDAAKELHAGQHLKGFEKFPLRIEGAEWIHPGVSDILTRARGGAPVACVCRNSRFTIDPSGRLFVPDSIGGRIQVIDSAGNTIRYIGARGKANEKLEFRWPEIALGGEDCCFVIDDLQAQATQVKLGYQASEEIVLTR